MQLLVINLHSARNAGDAALLEMTVHTLRSTMPESQITLAMNDLDIRCIQHRLGDIDVVESFAAHYSGHRPRSHWRLDALVLGTIASLVAAVVYRTFGRMPHMPRRYSKLWTAYAKADRVISCPGNIFASMGRLGLPLLVSAWSIAFALLLGKPLYVLPQSIGPLYHRWEHWLLRTLYSKARTILIREPVSLSVAQETRLKPERMHLVPDLAFAYPPDNRPEDHVMLDKLRNCPKPVVGVTVINRLISSIDSGKWDQYERALAHALGRFMDQYGGSIVFFPQVIGPTPKEDDRIAARRIVSLMDTSTSAIVIDEWIPPHTLKAMYGLTDMFVATRMHSAIFATSMHVPTLLIEYLHKIRGLAEMLSMEEWMLELSQVDETTLWTSVDALWHERDAVKEHLEKHIPLLASQASQVGHYLSRD